MLEELSFIKQQNIFEKGLIANNQNKKIIIYQSLQN